MTLFHCNVYQEYIIQCLQAKRGAAEPLSAESSSANLLSVQSDVDVMNVTKSESELATYSSSRNEDKKGTESHL